MKSKHKQMQEMASLCDEIGVDDGIDPHKLSKNKDHEKTDLRKVRQLCKHIEKTLNLVFDGELSDPLFNSLSIVSVRPSDMKSQIIVTVATSSTMEDSALIMQALQNVKGYLRSAVANSIRRRRVPDLNFQLLSLIQGIKEVDDAC